MSVDATSDILLRSKIRVCDNDKVAEHRTVDKLNLANLLKIIKTILDPLILKG